jgi:hypothetical protein
VTTSEYLVLYVFISFLLFLCLCQVALSHRISSWVGDDQRIPGVVCFLVTFSSVLAEPLLLRFWPSFDGLCPAWSAGPVYHFPTVSSTPVQPILPCGAACDLMYYGYCAQASRGLRVGWESSYY